MKNEPLYLAFLVYFNRDRDYFECHEVMEELWLAQESDPLYKGLLQIAVGLFHFRYGNVIGRITSYNVCYTKLLRERTEGTVCSQTESGSDESPPYLSLAVVISLKAWSVLGR